MDGRTEVAAWHSTAAGLAMSAPAADLSYPGLPAELGISRSSPRRSMLLMSLEACVCLRSARHRADHSRLLATFDTKGRGGIRLKAAARDATSQAGPHVHKDCHKAHPQLRPGRRANRGWRCWRPPRVASCHPWSICRTQLLRPTQVYVDHQEQEAASVQELQGKRRHGRAPPWSVWTAAHRRTAAGADRRKETGPVS